MLLVKLVLLILLLPIALQAETIVVPAGGDAQAAINQAQAGDVVVLEAGATFGQLTVPNKGITSPVIIQSSRIAELPAGRVSPAQAPLMARIQTPTVEPALSTATGAGYYTFIGIEFTMAVTGTYSIIRLETDGQDTLAKAPHHLTFDRCYIHGQPSMNSQRGITMNSSSTTIINSYISDIHWVGVEAHAIGCWNGPGPFTINNNYLEAAGINILFGGAIPAIPNLIPSDITITSNHIYKPLSWHVGDPTYAGIHWTVKNLLELKSARRVLIDSNLMENSWADSQVGWAIIFNVTDDSGSNVIEDVQVTHNIIKHSANGINMRGARDACDVVRMKRINLADNSLEDIGAYGGESKPLQLLSGSEDVTIEHNSIEARHSVIILDGCGGLKHTRLVMKSNLANHGTYGVFGNGGTFGTAALDTFAASWTFQKNALYNMAPSGLTPSRYPPDNYFPATLAEASGLLGTDGLPVGVRGGSVPTPTPTPTPSPSPTPTPTPSPTPPTIPCSIIVPPTVSMAQWSSVVVTVSGNGDPGTLTASAATGQVAVTPTSRSVGQAFSAQYRLDSKKKGSSVTFNSTCGSRTMQVVVN